jgi:hypothetical protein
MGSRIFFKLRRMPAIGTHSILGRLAIPGEREVNKKWEQHNAALDRLANEGGPSGQTGEIGATKEVGFDYWSSENPTNAHGRKRGQQTNALRFTILGSSCG